MRNPQGEAYLKAVLHLPLPQTGRALEGQIAERKDLEMLQAEAIQWLAYAGTSTADAEVLGAVAQHPSPHVRAEAVRAYLFNHQQDPGAARAVLLRVLQPNDRRLLDIPEHNQEGAAFDRELARYLQMFPAVQAPPPMKAGTGVRPPIIR